MNYKQFSSKENIVENLLFKLGIIKNERLLIEVDNWPDHDISEYQREMEANYYFQNHWNFSNRFSSLIEARFTEKYLFHSEGLKRVSEELQIEINYSQIPDFLNAAYQADKDCFDAHSFPVELDEFKLKSLRVSSLDNFQKQLNYEGSFYGNNEAIEPLDWGIYSFLELAGVPHHSKLNFYEELISESYLLSRQGNNKLAYFLAYSAFENFINSELGTVDEKGELKRRISELFGATFTHVAKHQVYTSLINEFKVFTEHRNTIAHGKEAILVSESDVSTILIFVLTMIASYNLNCTRFEHLYQGITE